MAADRFILALNDVDGGRIAFAATPATDAILPVAGELLAALGKENPPEGFHALDRERAPVWLAAHSIRHVVILRADLYHHRLLTEIDELLSPLGITFWAVADELLPSRIASGLRETATVRVSWPEFQAMWPEPQVPSPWLTSPREAVPPVLAGVRSAAGGVRFDPAFVAAFQAAVGWVRDSGHPRRDVQEARLRSLVEQFDDPACQLSAVKAAKAVLAERGWQVSIRAEAIPSALDIDSDTAARSLQEYRDTRVTSIGALWASGMSAGEICALRISADESPIPELHGSLVVVQERLLPFVKAQVYARRRQGANAGAWLFLGERGQLSVRSVEGIALNWLQTIDPGVTREEMRRRRGADGRWLQARGVELSWMSRTDPRRPSSAANRALGDTVRRVLDEARNASAQCGCVRPHPSLAPGLPDWPPTRHHVSPSRNHPWAYRPRLWQAHRDRSDRLPAEIR
jgi:hypothetical protein